MQAADPDIFLKALLAAPRPNADKILAFYDHRAGMICKDPSLLLLPLDDHICHRGDGLFESVSYRDRRIFALEAHLDRMREGAEVLAIQPPMTFVQMRNLICDVAAAGGHDHGDLRIFLTRGPGGFGVSPTECPAAGLYIVALAASLPSPLLYQKGLAAFASSYPPKQDYLARIKNVNYLPNVFMAREALSRNLDVAVTFNAAGHMGEAAIANIAIVDEDGILRSPEFRQILPGTTLLAALDLAAAKMPVRLGPIHKDEIFKAREALLFTSAALCVPIVSFDDRPIGHGDKAGQPGPVAAWLKDELLTHMLAKGTAF